MIKRLYWSWCLTSDETYIAMMKREGHSDESLQALRHNCQELRVKLASCPPVDVDRVVGWACGLAVVSLCVILYLWR